MTIFDNEIKKIANQYGKNPVFDGIVDEKECQI